MTCRRRSFRDGSSSTVTEGPRRLGLPYLPIKPDPQSTTPGRSPMVVRPGSPRRVVFGFAFCHQDPRAPTISSEGG